MLPEDATERLRATLGLGGGDPPTVEVYYNAEDPVKRRFVEATIEAQLAEANDALSDAVLREAARYIDVIVRGGDVDLPIVGAIEILGLERSRAIIDSVAQGLPRDAPERVALEQVSRFARLAAENLDVSQPILASIGSPVEVEQTVVNGSRTPLDAFAVAVAVAVSLMLVTLLLAAGLLALEREEQAFSRLVRGLVSRTSLLLEKLVLSALCALAVTLADAVRAGGVRGARLEPRAGLARRAGRRRDRLRRDGHRHRRAGARGARRLAARHPARAPDRVPRARAVGQREPGALRRGQRRVGAVPLQAVAARARRRDQRRRDARCPSCTSSDSPRPSS